MESLPEEWRPVIGCEGQFEVSNAGRVKRLAHMRNHWCGRPHAVAEYIIKPSHHTGGYRFVNVGNGSKRYVHRLVMEAFSGPANGRDVNHINGDKTDNRLANLEYCDRLHNVRHAIRTGLQDNGGEGNGMHKLTAEQVIYAHRRVQRGDSRRDVAADCGVSESCIYQIAKGIRWKHLNLPAIA